MKIATSMWGFRQWDWLSVLDYCADTGIVAVEAQVHPQAPQHFRLDMTDAQLAQVRNALAARGLTLQALSLANDFTVPADKLSQEVQGVKEGLNLARRLHIRRVRIFAGWASVSQYTPMMRQRLLAALRDVSRVAESWGIQLALENHGGITATADDVLNIIEQAGCESLGALYDGANFARSNQDPLEALDRIGRRLVYSHAKDLASPAQGGAVCPVGAGVLPWAAIVRKLAVDPAAMLVIEQTDPADVSQATRQSFCALSEMCCPPLLCRADGRENV